ncbi:MAG: TonB-dependent receptor [Prevotellaceae bacterium]|jgi:hypothetical protein|nr:TonB-dependent receptor [Prevotellaceae bacterium]
MRTLFYIIILLLISRFLPAQTFIGKVIDENRQPVVFANVTLLALPDSVFVVGATTDENGIFLITTDKTENDYLLKISFLGYESFTIILNSDSRQDLGDITLKTNTIQMKEVLVVAQQPKIRFEKGMYIADIEHSMAANGNTVESLLNQLPSVWASNSGISVSGRSGVAVYINNRLINLQGEALMKYLQNIRSENISKIEIMQNASAEFSAAGAGGVIRIVTKRIIDEGWRGTVSTAALYQNYGGVAPYFNLMYGKGKFGAELAFSAEKSKWLSYVEENSRDFVNLINYQTAGKDTIFDHNYSTDLTLNYNFNHYNKLILNAYYMYWGKDERFDQTTAVSGNRLTDVSATQNSHQTEQDMYSYSFTVNYELLLDSLGKNKITLLADYNNQYQYDTKDFLHYLNKNGDGNLVSDENLLNEQSKPYRIYSAEVRYKHDFGKSGSGLTGVSILFTSPPKFNCTPVMLKICCI